MGAGLDEPVSVGWAAPEKAPFPFGHVGHGRAHSDLDPVAFSLRHPAKQQHEQVVGLGFRVDATAHLRHPELDAMMVDRWEGVLELVSIEGPVRLANHHRLPPAVRIREHLKQPRRLRSARPRNRPRLTEVEELVDDQATHRLDQLPGTALLPPSGRVLVLMVLGADSTVEDEPHGSYAACPSARRRLSRSC